MRILIISTYFPPVNSIASQRPYSWAKAFSRDGHDVTVLTTEKEILAETDLKQMTSTCDFNIISIPLPKWLNQIKLQYRSSHPHAMTNYNLLHRIKHVLKKITINIFHFLRYKKGILNTCRMPDFTDFWIRPALNAIKYEHPWDVVISSSGPYATHVVASGIKKRQQALMWVADYRDAWSDSRIYPGIFPFNRFEAWLEKRLLRHADLITTVSDPFASTYAKKFPRTKVKTIENGFDSSDLKELLKDSIFPNDGKFRIVYTGSIYAGKQDPSPLFQAIDMLLKDKTNHQLLKHLEVLFVGSNHSQIQHLIEQYQLAPWIKINGVVSREDALRMQRDAHALLFLAWNDLSTDGVMTGKLFEYLFSKTPILSISHHGIEAAQKLILEANAGIVYTHPHEIAEWLRHQLMMPEKKQVQVDLQILNRYERDHLAEKLYRHIATELLESRSFIDK